MVPQPVRAMAFIRMARYWAGAYHVGRDYHLPPRLVGNTLAGITMVESWFEHRGEHTNRDGSRDVGLGGASEFCRRVMRARYHSGRADFAVTDEDYVNPWHATRVLAFWFDLMLAEAKGDLELAIAADHTGIGAASDADGAAYAANVIRRRRRFIRNADAPAGWSLVHRLIFPNDVGAPASDVTFPG